MTAPDYVVRAVRDVLKRKATRGQTTKHDVVLEAIGKLKHIGGKTPYGIGLAMLVDAARRVVEDEVSRQMSARMTEHDFRFVLPASTPMDTIAMFGKIPSRWIAIADGPGAPWVFALSATADQWRQNATLKGKKARQTQAKSDVSLEIALFLESHKFTCLAEAMTKGV
jgi:hypothetical protein